MRRLRQFWFGLTFAPWPCVPPPNWASDWSKSDTFWYIIGALTTVTSIINVAAYMLVVK